MANGKSQLLYRQPPILSFKLKDEIASVPTPVQCFNDRVEINLAFARCQVVVFANAVAEVDVPDLSADLRNTFFHRHRVSARHMAGI